MKLFRIKEHLRPDCSDLGETIGHYHSEEEAQYTIDILIYQEQAIIPIYYSINEVIV